MESYLFFRLANVLLSRSSCSSIGSVLICSIFRFFGAPGFLGCLFGVFVVDFLFDDGTGGGGGSTSGSRSG